MPELSPERTHTPAEVADAVQRVLARTLGLEPGRIRPEERLEDLGVDSLKTIEMNVALEEELGFTSPEIARPDELGIVTVRDLVRHVALVLDGGGR
jgi:acyl carrier protein